MRKYKLEGFIGNLQKKMSRINSFKKIKILHFIQTVQYTILTTTYMHNLKQRILKISTWKHETTPVIQYLIIMPFMSGSEIS